MGKKPLTRESEFVVREEKVLVFILAFLFFALFLYGLIDTIIKGIKNINYLNGIFMVSLGPALIFFTKGRNKRIYLRVNKTGIFQDEELLTTWTNYLGAYITEKAKVLSIQDNFQLVIEFQKDGTDTKGFRRKIKLTNTQNKSEEEIMEAVKFFWKEFGDPDFQ